MLVSLVASCLLSIWGAAEREIDIPMPVFVFAAVVAAPPLETLIMQAFPIWVARKFGASFAIQIVASTTLFFAAHVIEGIGTGIAAGLIGGFYFAFTYAHWRQKSRWTAFWTTAASHAIHNVAILSLAFAFGEM